MPRPLLLIILLFSFGFAQAQTFDTLWHKMLGGTADDQVKQILVRPDGGMFVFGETKSYNGDVAGNHGSTDLWIMSLSRWGDVLWEKCIGGSYDEQFVSARWIDDRSMEVRALSQSQDGHVECVWEQWGPKAPLQSWKFGIDVAGNLLRQGCIPEEQFEYTYFADHRIGFAGNQLYFFNENGDLSEKKAYHGTIRSLQFLADGSTLLVGESNENPRRPGTQKDAWVAKVDAQRVLRWEKWFGGSLDDHACWATESEQGLVIACDTRSQDGDVEAHTENAGEAKAWLLLLSPEGNLLRQVVMPGGGNEEIAGVGTTPEGDVVLAGSYRDGRTGHRKVPDISWDFWMMRIRF
jgi:hypothetical protein